MIIFLYGQDTYRTNKKLQEITNEYKLVNKSGFSLVNMDAKERNFKDFLDNFRVVSMFGEKKLIILKNIFSNQTFKEDFLEEMKIFKISNNIIVIFEEGEVDKRTKIFKALIKNARCQEFDFLNDKNLKIWFQKECKKYNLKIDISAEATLLSFVGNNLWQLENEIKKLANFKPGKLIKKDDIILQVRPKIENDIFMTIDAISQKDKSQAFLFLHKHLENGDNPLYLLSMINYQIRNFLIIKELVEKGLPYSVIVKKSALHPFVAKKSFSACGQFSFLRLKKIYQKIFQIDLDIKTGKIDAETALDLLVAEI